MRHFFVSHGVAVAMSLAAFLLTGFVAVYVIFPASMPAALYTARAGAAMALIILEHFKVVRARMAPFGPAGQVCLMELS
jgi:hypothetical protein